LLCVVGAIRAPAQILRSVVADAAEEEDNNRQSLSPSILPAGVAPKAQRRADFEDHSSYPQAGYCVLQTLRLKM
jgi:hypothetical protein